MRRLVVTVIACVAAACGLDLSGSLGALPLPGDDAGDSVQDTGISTIAPTTDASTGDASNDWPDASNIAACTCSLTAPAGFTLIAFAGTQSAPCSGDLKTVDVVFNPVAAADACTCGACSITQKPDCNTGNFNSDFDNTTGPTCGTRGLDHPANNGACTAYTGTYAKHGRAVAPPAAGPTTCTSNAVAKIAGANGTPARACVPNGSTCPCDPSLAAGYRTCLRAPGDVACPAEAPKKILVGASTSLACTACSCTATATCAGTSTFYADGNCATPIFTIDTKQCITEGSGNGGTYYALKWTGVTETQCAVGTSTATASLTSPSTICCPQ